MSHDKTQFYAKLCHDNLEDYGKKTDHLKMLSEELYADQSHFLFEILQNAEDAEAKKIEFHLFPDRLDIYHNGERLFSEKDVIAITQFSRSTKNDLTKIGKFGLGFKSVHTITDCPEIYCRDFHFCIESYIRPREVKPSPILKGMTTLFSLPFKKAEAKEIYKRLTDRLKQLDARCLLFLKNIKDISYEIDNDKGVYYRENEPNPNKLIETTLISENGQDNFLLFQKEEGNKKIALAFAYPEAEKGKKRSIDKAKNTDLFVWFPTEKETDLHFLLNGNFVTTASRENTPEDNVHNKVLIQLAAELLAEALPKLKAAGLCDVAFLQCLPIESENFPEGSFFYPLFEKVKTLLSEGEYLPTEKQSFTCGKNAVLADTAKLPEIYQTEGKIWLSTDITADKKATSTLWEYLTKTLTIEIISPDKFARRINEPFLKNQTDEWFIQFYIFLYGQKALWKEKSDNKSKTETLRSKPIIRREDNTLCLPESEKVFLPDGTKGIYPTVKKAIVQNEDALEFLKVLGLHKPDIVNYIAETILPKYADIPEVNDETYRQDLQQILDVLTGESVDACLKLRKQLSECNVVKCEDGIFRKISEVYCPSDLLKGWFAYSDNIHFADETILPADEWAIFGVADLPKRIKLEELPENIKLEEDWNQIRSPENYTLVGIDDFLNNLTFDNAYILAEVLHSLYERDHDLFKGSQEYCYYGWMTFKFKNTIYQTLRQTAWVPDKDSNLCKPVDITREDIAENLSNLCALPLPFKPNISQSLQEQAESLGMTLMRTDEAEALKRDKEAAEQKAADLEERLAKFEQAQTSASTKPDPIWNPSISVEAAPHRKILDTSGKDNKEPTLSVPNKNYHRGESIIELKLCDTFEPPELPVPIDIKAIGEWGEGYILNILHEVYPDSEVINWNRDGDIGAGCDIVVKKEEKIIAYVEVKATESLASTEFRISRRQWESAESTRERYWLYIVFGAGTDEVRYKAIQNPFEKWKNGDLEARPVGIIVQSKA